MIFHIGQRVTLAYSSDAAFPAQPGDGGTVVAVDATRGIVDVDWDAGIRHPVNLGDGDRLTAGHRAAQQDSRTWQAPVRAAAQAAADTAADWWAQDTVGGRATGDVAATARRVMDGIADGDPAVLETLPLVPDPDEIPRAYDDSGAVPPWTALTDAQRAAVENEFMEAFHAALLDRVTAHCRAAAPAAEDLSHLGPGNLRIGGVGIFAGDWAWTTTPEGSARIPVGFVGTLIDTWNGWAVFSCTRTVAEAIVGDLDRLRADYRQARARDGLTGRGLDRDVDQAFTGMWFDGDILTADSRALTGDDSDIERISPDPDGRYVVMGWSWHWTAVDPAACDRIAGTLPAPDAQQEWEPLTHTPWTRVGPQQFRITTVARRAAPAARLSAHLRQHGLPAAVLTRHGSGPAEMTALTGERFDSRDWQAFVTASRHRGQPMTETRVLEALVAEHEFQEAVDAAGRDGDTLIRLLDDTDDRVVTVDLVAPAPRLWTEVRALAAALRTPHQLAGTWQIWNGGAWEDLAPTGPPLPPAATATAGQERPR